MKRFVILLLFVSALLLPEQASALCDVAQGRVIHANSTPFNSPVATSMVYYVAAPSVFPTFYYVFTTSNQTYIDTLNAALISGKQVRVTGNVATCPADGTYRTGGSVVAVFLDTFY